MSDEDTNLGIETAASPNVPLLSEEAASSFTEVVGSMVHLQEVLTSDLASTPPGAKEAIGRAINLIRDAFTQMKNEADQASSAGHDRQYVVLNSHSERMRVILGFMDVFKQVWSSPDRLDAEIKLTTTLLMRLAVRTH